MSKLLKYADEAYQTAVEKGFWEHKENRNKGEMVMLMISELGECLEAHRSGKRFISVVPTRVGHETINLTNLFNGEWSDYVVDVFKEFGKDTVEDELADVVVRLFDYTKGWGIKMNEFDINSAKSTENFGEDLLFINTLFTQAYWGHTEWEKVLASIEAFAGFWNIDLDQQMRWKMTYNKTRAKKHGKAY